MTAGTGPRAGPTGTTGVATSLNARCGRFIRSIAWSIHEGPALVCAATRIWAYHEGLGGCPAVDGQPRRERPRQARGGGVAASRLLGGCDRPPGDAVHPGRRGEL